MCYLREVDRVKEILLIYKIDDGQSQAGCQHQNHASSTRRSWKAHGKQTDSPKESIQQFSLCIMAFLEKLM